MLARAFHARPGVGLADPRRRAARAAAAVALPRRLRRHRRRRLDDGGRRASARRAGCRRAGRRCGSAATLQRARHDAVRLGTATAPFLAYGRAVEQLRAEAVPGPHWYLAGIGVDPSAQRQGIGAALLAARASRAAARARAARRAADEQRGEPALLRAARLRGRARGRHAGGRPAGLGYGQAPVTTLPKRFPDRDEIAAVRAEADALEDGVEGADERRLAGRVLARRDMGKLVFLDLVDRSGPDPAALPGGAHRRGRRAPRRHRRRDRQADEEPPRRAVADRRRARAALARSGRRCPTRSTA